MVLEPCSVGVLLPVLRNLQGLKKTFAIAHFHFENEPTKPRGTVWAQKLLHQAMVVEGPHNFMRQEHMVIDKAFSPPMCILVHLNCKGWQ